MAYLPPYYKRGDQFGAKQLNDMLRELRRSRVHGLQVRTGPHGSLIIPVASRKQKTKPVSSFVDARITKFSDDETHFWGVLLDDTGKAKQHLEKDDEGNDIWKDNPPVEIFCRKYGESIIWKCVPSQKPGDDIVIRAKPKFIDGKHSFIWESCDGYTPAGCVK